MVRSLFCAALVAFASHSHAASLALVGPEELPVGQTATYSLLIVLDSAETLHGAGAVLVAENGRAFASFEAKQRSGIVHGDGFFGHSYTIDVAAYYGLPGYETMPVFLEGGPDQPWDDAINEPREDYAASDGPFELFPFTITGISPGEIRLIGNASSQNPVILFSTSESGVVAHDVPAGLDGVYARIQIVPEPGALALLASAVLLRRAGRRVTVRFSRR